jgi:hypothetical protein
MNNKQFEFSANNRENTCFSAPKNEEELIFAEFARMNKKENQALNNNALASFDELLAQLDENKPQQNDQLSNIAVDEFKAIISNGKLTSGEIDEAYLRCARQISINAPEAWALLNNEYSKSIANAYTPNTSMDAQSRSAIEGFKSTINPAMTRDEMLETFIRFSREVSIKFPDAWKELESILSNSLPEAYRPDTSMDSQSRNAVADFKGALNAGMTADEMNEIFVRFSRQISVKYPDAWKELESILNNSLPIAYRPDTTMDDQSRNAITNFKSTINTNLTKDEMVELFVRFSREVSVKFPEAWKDLEAILNQNIPEAFKPNTKSDPLSELAVNNFKQSIQENHTKDDLVELFLRFSRDISIKYPDKKNELLAIFNNALTEAFNPDTTIDDHSKELVNNFKTIIANQQMDNDSFKDVFAEYFNQIGLNLSKAKRMMDNLKVNNFREAEKLTENRTNTKEEAGKLNHLFNALVQDVNSIDYKVQIASNELNGIFNKDAQRQKNAEIDLLIADKYQKDERHFSLMSQINGNNLASQNIQDNYIASINVDRTAPGKKEILQRDSAKLTDYDMMRAFKRDDVKGLINEIPKHQLTDILYNVPKYQLINGLTLLSHEQQIEALTVNRFEDALLRDMPRKQLIEQLPDAYEMLPILMMLGKTENGFTNGADLIKDTIINGKDVEEKPSNTKLQEELLPFMMEQLLNKTPRMAEVTQPASFSLKVKPEDKETREGKQKVQAQSVQDLMPEELKNLTQEALNLLGDEEMTDAAAAKRGDSENLLNFIEDIGKVDSVDAGKMAMENLYNSQAQDLKQDVLTRISDNEILKINKFYGRDPKEMMKQMPQFVVSRQLHDLSKVQVVESYKTVGKDMIMNRLQTLPSQVLAKAAVDVVDRDSILNQLANKEGIAA